MVPLKTPSQVLALAYLPHSPIVLVSQETNVEGLGEYYPQKSSLTHSMGMRCLSIQHDFEFVFRSITLLFRVHSIQYLSVLLCL